MKPTAASSTNAHQLAWWAKDAVVYFIAARKPAIAVKIGVTTWTTVARRLGALQSANHESLELLGVIPFRHMAQPMKAPEDKERALHQQFRHLQRTREGNRGYEWFTADDELLRFIRSASSKPDEFGFRRTARSDSA
jgi:hypothetical protein